MSEMLNYMYKNKKLYVVDLFLIMELNIKYINTTLQNVLTSSYQYINVRN